MNGRAPWPLRILGRLIGLAIILTGIAAAVMAARTSTGNPRTDDAYVSANVIGFGPCTLAPFSNRSTGGVLNSPLGLSSDDLNGVTL